jgi:methyltransferase
MSLIFLIAFQRIDEVIIGPKKKGTGDPTLVALVVLYASLILLISIEFFVKKSVEANIVNYLAILAYISSYLLRRWAIRSLGRSWQVDLNVVPQGNLVVSGPYRFIRHPVYLATIIEVLGIPFIVGARYSFYFSLFTLIPVILFRAHKEEAMLYRRFRKRYEQYRRITPAFIPNWRKFYELIRL